MGRGVKCDRRRKTFDVDALFSVEYMKFPSVMPFLISLKYNLNNLNVIFVLQNNAAVCYLCQTDGLSNEARGKTETQRLLETFNIKSVAKIDNFPDSSIQNKTFTNHPHHI